MREDEVVFGLGVSEPLVEAGEDGAEGKAVVDRRLGDPRQASAKGRQRRLLFRLNVKVEGILHVDVTGSAGVEG